MSILRLACLAAIVAAPGCKSACDTAIEHLDGCALSSLPVAAAADAGALDAGAGSPPDPATTCTGVLECDAKCISEASCEDLAKKEPHGAYQLCLEQCVSGGK